MPQLQSCFHLGKSADICNLRKNLFPVEKATISKQTKLSLPLVDLYRPCAHLYMVDLQHGEELVKAGAQHGNG